MEQFSKLSALKFWKKLMWILTGGCGAYCAFSFLLALVQELPRG